MLLVNQKVHSVRGFGKRVSSLDEVPNGKKLIALGSIVSYELIKKGRVPGLMIYNARNHSDAGFRVVKKALDAFAFSEFVLKNARGTIQEEAWSSIDEALRVSNAKIVVHSSEDSLLYPAVILAPTGSIVCRSDGNGGFRVVETSDRLKRKAQAIVQEFKFKQ